MEKNTRLEIAALLLAAEVQKRGLVYVGIVDHGRGDIKLALSTADKLIEESQKEITTPTLDEMFPPSEG